jgi:hypothetical protein
MALLFMGSLILMGSESSWFPWVNLSGVGMLVAFGILSNRLAETDWKEIDQKHLERKKSWRQQ